MVGAVLAQGAHGCPTCTVDQGVKTPSNHSAAQHAPPTCWYASLHCSSTSADGEPSVVVAASMRRRNGGVQSAAGSPAAAAGLPGPCCCVPSGAGPAASSASFGMGGSAAAGRVGGSGGSCRGWGRRSACWCGSGVADGGGTLGDRRQLGWRGRWAVGGGQANCAAPGLASRRRASMGIGYGVAAVDQWIWTGSGPAKSPASAGARRRLVKLRMCSAEPTTLFLVIIPFGAACKNS